MRHKRERKTRCGFCGGMKFLAARTGYDIPGNLLLAIGIQEAGSRSEQQACGVAWTAIRNGTGTFFGKQTPPSKHDVRRPRPRGRSLDRCRLYAD